MKKIITILLLFCFASNFAQNNTKMERLKSLQIAFISNKLDLTTQEAEKFWPIFNQFENRQIELRKQKRLIMFNLKNASGISDKEMMKMIDDSENIETDIQNNRKNFVRNLQGVISPQKILLLKQADEDFKKTLLKQFKQRRGNFKEE
jgi:hypothetical protein